MNRHPRFNIDEVNLLNLCYRQSQVDRGQLFALPSQMNVSLGSRFTDLVDLIRHEKSVLLFSGAHPLKLGLSRFLIDLIERGFINHFATNGAGLVHDFELSLAGETSEDVARWIQIGQFGLWQETSRLNEIIRDAAHRDEGLGEAIGRVIEEEQFPQRDISVAAACWRKGIPCTCHVTVGADIIHAMPNCDGAALGQTSYTDFLIFAHTVSQLEDGAFLNIGSAVTGPEEKQQPKGKCRADCFLLALRPVFPLNA